MKKYFILWASMALFLTNCKKNDDSIIVKEQEEQQEVKVVLNNEINEFVWSAMNSWYFWQGQVVELGDDRFADENAYFTFLNGFNTPRGLFQTLRSPKDRFSWIVDDYDLLFNAFAGIYKTTGMEFVFSRPPEGGNKVVGVVRYVITGSDAEAKNVKRGDVFYAINGTELFAETDVEGNITSSNLDLLNQDTFTVNFAEITADNITVPNDVNIELVKQEITENPILVSKTFDVNGTKIGYVMYNSFNDNFDIQLNEAFGQLKSENVTELVLDLRYNPGGKGISAMRLCSMITGQFTDQLLGKDTYNAKWDEIFGSEQLFVDRIDEIPINHLNLEKVYIIATDDSASASEYVLNNLAPYIDVVHIGDVTVGKNQLSVTLLDAPAQEFVQPGFANLPLPFLNYGPLNTIDNSNPNHKYALQPIVGVGQNSAGFGDFTDGLQPDFLLQESLGNLGKLGEQGEPLLDLAIEKITGVSSKSLRIQVPNNMKIKTISSSTRLRPFTGGLHKGFIGVK